MSDASYAPGPDRPPGDCQPRIVGRRNPHKASQALEQGRARLLVTAAMFLLGFMGIGAGLVDATVLSQGTEPGIAQAQPANTLQAGRADIVDRNGVVVATSLATASLYADPQLVIDPAEAAEKLASVLPGIDRMKLLAELSTDKRFVWIKRNLTPTEHYLVHRLGIPGIAFQREERRIYPAGSLLSHVVGFTGVDNNGLMGIEQSFDTALRGASEPLRLSIDVRLQHLIRRELRATIEEFSAIGGAGMILDLHTGELLAMVSLPDFDPNAPTNLDENTRFNRNTLGVYEMGSSFKIFNSALAFESGKIRITDSFDAIHPIRIGRHTINDFRGKNRWLTVPEVFMYSSNLGSVRMVLEVGTEAQKELLGRLGLLAKPTIEIPEVGSPIVPNPWREVNTMTISFGHGLSVSPLQLATAAAAVVNGGTLRPATLLKRDPRDAMPGHRAISPETSALMRRMLRVVVTDGGASGANAPGYVVGGKTGTAEKITAGGGYNRKSRISSFVGAFPMHDPRYLVLVMVDEPKGTARTYGYATGGWVAAPAVGRIVKQMGPMLGIMPVDENRPDIRQMLDINASPRGGTLASY
jgi:cell division protein FtsI (penicillin-binding protein 3)